MCITVFSRLGRYRIFQNKSMELFYKESPWLEEHRYVITPLLYGTVPQISPNSKSQKPGIVLRARVEKKSPGRETEPQRKTKRGTAGVKHMRVGPRKYHGSPPNPKPYASPRSGCGGWRARWYTAVLVVGRHSALFEKPETKYYR